MRFLLGIMPGLCGRLADAALTIVKAEAAAAYVRCVVKVREVFAALVSLAAFLLLALAGFVLVHVALFVWLPWSIGIKALVLLILGAAYFGVGLAAALSSNSDKAWMKFAKVDGLLAGPGR